MNRTISLKEAERVVELNRRQKENEYNHKLNKWIESQIGSTWVYRNNCYSSDSERWDVFMIIKDRVGNCQALVETYEMRDKDRVIEINREVRHLYHEEGFTGYIVCDKKEFLKNKTKILKRLHLTEEKESQP